MAVIGEIGNNKKKLWRKKNMQKKFVLKKKSSVEDEKGKRNAVIYRPSDFDEKEMWYK